MVKGSLIDSWYFFKKKCVIVLPCFTNCLGWSRGRHWGWWCRRRSRCPSRGRWCCPRRRGRSWWWQRPSLPWAWAAPLAVSSRVSAAFSCLSFPAADKGGEQWIEPWYRKLYHFQCSESRERIPKRLKNTGSSHIFKNVWTWSMGDMELFSPPLSAAEWPFLRSAWQVAVGYIEGKDKKSPIPGQHYGCWDTRFIPRLALAAPVLGPLKVSLFLLALTLRSGQQEPFCFLQW